MRGKLGLVVVAALCAVVSGSSAPASATTADDKMKSNLRNLATMEETFLTDHSHYGTAKELRADGYRLRVPSGQVIYIHLDNEAWGYYCFAGRVARHHWFIYASDKGGLYGPKRHDACDAATYPRSAGQYPAR